MTHVSNPVAGEIGQYLHVHQHKGLLRFITCGSVDDGKSTLIGRLLYESKAIFEDQLATLANDSKKVGTQRGELDFALLVDGLAAERAQGITIDVAYRFFSTDRRKFIVADTPGHEQYTRNMATGASTADVAILMIDAVKGVLTQTRRHSYIASLLGIRHLVLGVNKLDLVNYSQIMFDRIVAEYRAFAKLIDIEQFVAIPLSALKGDNITAPSENTPWYQGPTLMEYLETVEVDSEALQREAFRMPVQWVNRPNAQFRGFSGRVVGGTLRPGERVRVLPCGRESTVQRIVTFDGDLTKAVCGQSITVTLTEEIDISRGDVLCSAAAPCPVADRLEAHVLWMSDVPMRPGHRYLMKTGAKTTGLFFSAPKHKIDINSMEPISAKNLELNEVGVCNLRLDQAIAFDSYQENRNSGSFIVIDRLSNATVAAGMLHFALDHSPDVHWQTVEINKQARAILKDQKPALLWFTGLSGAGKSTIANLVEKKLHAMGRHTYLLDGDNVRHGLNRDLGFAEGDRVENVRRVAEVAKLMVDAGLITLVSLISPYRAEREMARGLVSDNEFIEVFIETPLDIAETRDPKGLYRKARQGLLKNFTGIDSPYERPENPELRIDTTQLLPEVAADRIVEYLCVHLLDVAS